MLLLTLDIYPGVLALFLGTDKALVKTARNVRKHFVSSALPIKQSVYKEHRLPVSVALAGFLCD